MVRRGKEYYLNYLANTLIVSVNAITCINTRDYKLAKRFLQKFDTDKECLKLV